VPSALGAIMTPLVVIVIIWTILVLTGILVIAFRDWREMKRDRMAQIWDEGHRADAAASNPYKGTHEH
jgi:hypothetical protein